MMRRVPRIKLQNKPVGGLTDLQYLVFIPEKFSRGGDGGLITTNDDNLARKHKIV